MVTYGEFVDKINDIYWHTLNRHELKSKFEEYLKEIYDTTKLNIVYAENVVDVIFALAVAPVSKRDNVHTSKKYERILYLDLLHGGLFKGEIDAKYNDYPLTALPYLLKEVKINNTISFIEQGIELNNKKINELVKENNAYTDEKNNAIAQIDEVLNEMKEFLKNSR